MNMVGDDCFELGFTSSNSIVKVSPLVVPPPVAVKIRIPEGWSHEANVPRRLDVVRTGRVVVLCVPELESPSIVNLLPVAKL